MYTLGLGRPIGLIPLQGPAQDLLVRWIQEIVLASMLLAGMRIARTWQLERNAKLDRVAAAAAAELSTTAGGEGRQRQLCPAAPGPSARIDRRTTGQDDDLVVYSWALPSPARQPRGNKSVNRQS